jgi:DNA-binding response OmpR family regulator
MHKRVLVCSEDDDLAGLIRVLVEGHGCEVETRSTPCLAGDRQKPLIADLAVLELSLGDELGLADSLRSLIDIAPAGMPILVLTSRHGRTLRQAERSGPLIVVSKPFDIEALDDALRSCLAADRCDSVEDR